MCAKKRKRKKEKKKATIRNARTVNGQRKTLRQERRKSPRQRLVMFVEATIGGKEKRLRMLNAGPKGVFLAYSGLAERRTPVELQVTVPDQYPLIRRGVVARILRPTEPAHQAREAGIGVEFFENDPEWDRFVAGKWLDTNRPPEPAERLSRPAERPSYPGSTLCVIQPTEGTAPPHQDRHPHLYRITPRDSQGWENLMEQYVAGGGIRLRQVPPVALPSLAVVIAVDPNTHCEWFLPGTALPSGEETSEGKGVFFRFSPVSIDCHRAKASPLPFLCEE